MGPFQESVVVSRPLALNGEGFIISIMIKITSNKELDYKVYVDFYNHFRAGADFGAKIKQDHPNINLENYKKYIDDFYVAHQVEILKKQEGINKILLEKQDKFFLALKNIFNIDFTGENYQGYLSIFNCNPRYLETKTFQIYYKKELIDMLEVAFHESTHFAFFDYLDKNFLEQVKDLDKNNGILWEMSEILNIIILNLPSFRRIMGREEKLFYPNLKNKLDQANIMWNSTKDINTFVVKYLNEIKYRLSYGSNG